MTKEEIINVSNLFWKATENADETVMRKYADKDIKFVHIGITCCLDEEISFYTSGTFKPTKIDFHKDEVRIFDTTAILIRDLDYTLLLNGQETTHHFAVTEVYNLANNDIKLLQLSFTALVY